MLKIENLQVHYGGIQALRGISLEVPDGRIVTLIGANGAGKSTTLRTITGLVKASGGSVQWDGQELLGKSIDKIISTGIAMSPEGRRVFPDMTVLENLKIGAYLRRDKAEIEKDIQWVYSLFPRLEERSWQLAGTLSGGEQQMLAVGRALMSRPKLMMLDEPSLGLAPLVVQDIFSIIKRNDQLRWAVALILLYNVGIQLIMGVATYYFAYVCNKSEMLSVFMISASIAEVVGLLIFPKITKLLSRKKAFLLACILPAIGLTILLLTGIFAPQNIVLTVIAGIIVKTGTGLELGCATVFLADVVDYGEYKLGTRNEGVVFSLQTLIVKLTAAFTSLSIGFALDLTGYVPNQIQSLATQNSMRFLMCIVPAVSMLLAYVIYRRKYKLNDAYMKTIVAAISGNAQKASDTKAIAADPTEADVLPAEESVLETDNMGALS
mgnify:CR=1 FL=1